MPGYMICPYCHATVKPRIGADGQNVCPACNNRGATRPATPPRPAPAPAAPTPFSAPQPQAGPPRTSGQAVAALCLGIGSIVLAFLAIILSPLAIIFGVKALRETKDGTVGGRGLAIGGIITGCVGILIGLAVVLAAIVFVLVSNLASSAPEVELVAQIDGLGGYLEVVAADAGIPWSDLSISGTADCSLPSGTVDVGDRITCSTDGRLVVTHKSGETYFDGQV